jgi:hypothetical protein
MFKVLPKNIVIDAHPELFMFQCGKERLLLRPVIFLSMATGRVLSVGEAPSGEETYERVDLFWEIAELPKVASRFDCLECFFRFALAKVAGSSRFIRPSVTFRGLYSFNTILCGYQDFILEHAARAAGAQNIRIEPEK